MINLDTNILLRYIDGRLSARESGVLEDNAWALSNIVLWELAILERERQIQPVLQTRELSSVLRRTSVLSIDLRVAEALKLLDFRSDPADEIIAATSIVHDIPLLTRDQRILRSKIVPLALND